MSIAIVGDPEDLAAVYIGWLASRRNVEVLWLPEAALGVDWSFAIDEGSGQARLRTGGGWRDLRDVTGVFVRFHPDPPLPPPLSLDDGGRMLFVQERREGLHHFLQSLSCSVVNRPSAGRANASKPYQMQWLRQAGFSVPKWVTTNCADTALAFAAECENGVIYKAASGLRSRVRPLDDELQRRLRHGTSPTVIQEFVPGRDVRVHTVGDRAFATEVVADGVDYRYQQGSQYAATTVDDALARLCCEAALAEGLVLAGLDFRVTPAGEWYCLEMNPVPSFLPYEMCSGVPIGDAVVDVLCATPDRDASARLQEVQTVAQPR